MSGCVAAILLSCISMALAETTDIDQMLREANELVSTDPNRGEAILQRIASLSDRLSNQQRYRLQILQAKLLVIHGQYGKA